MSEIEINFEGRNTGSPAAQRVVITPDMNHLTTCAINNKYRDSVVLCSSCPSLCWGLEFREERERDD